MKLLLFLTTVLLSYGVMAKDICLEYSPGVMDVSITKTSNKEKVEAYNFLRDFNKLSLNKRNYQKMIDSYSSYDGSRSSIKNVLKEQPDFFTGYQARLDSQLLTSFDWGFYRLLLVNYKHEGQKIIFPEPVFCTNFCALSDFFFRPKAAEDIISSFIYRYKMSGAVIKNGCSVKPDFEVYPSYTVGKRENPLKVSFKPKLVNKSMDSLMSLGWLGSDGKCPEFFKQAKISGQVKNDQDYISRTKKFVEACAMPDTELGSSVPIIELENDKAKVKYMSFTPFVDFINKSLDFKLLYSFLDGENSVSIIKVSHEDGRILFLTLPLKTVKGKKALDWSYYNSVVAEMLNSQYFGSYLLEKM